MKSLLRGRRGDEVPEAALLPPPNHRSCQERARRRPRLAKLLGLGGHGVLRIINLSSFKPLAVCCALCRVPYVRPNGFRRAICSELLRVSSHAACVGLAA